MGRIPEETVTEVLAATDIVDLIGSYFPLKRSGSGFKCNCPFHNEKTPSFNISPVYQNYKCFGCGESGNAIGFLMNHENLPFIDAVKKLAQRANIQIIEDAYDPESDKRRRKISRLKEINNFSARYFHKQLMESPDAQHARDYMRSRGFSKDTATKWLIGWAPKNSREFFHTLKSEGFNGREILNAGLGGLRDKDNPRSGLWSKWYDQLTFPIYNDVGDVVGFSARILREDDKRGKYINTSDTVLFNKSSLLFGLGKARKAMGKKKFALICEGQLDTIVMHEAGFENTVAGLGTAFTEQHARILKRYTDHVTICYDGDSAGRIAAGKAFDHLTANGLTIKLVDMPDGHDPDSYLQEFGTEKLQELIEQARDFFDVKLDQEIAHTNLNSASERAKLLQDLASSVAKMADPLLQDATIQIMATRLRLGADEFRQIVSNAKAVAEKQAFFENRRASAQEPVEAKTEPTPIDSTIAYLCHLCLKSKVATESLCEQLESLYEPLQETAGGALLQLILARKPDTDSPAAVQAFLTTLPEADQLALSRTFTDAPTADPIKEVTESVTLLLATHFQKKEATIRAQLADPSLPSDQMFPLVEEIKQLQEFLKNLDSRFIR